MACLCATFLLNEWIPNDDSQCQWRRFGVFIVNFEHISHLYSRVSIVNFEHVIAGWVNNFPFFIINSWSCYRGWITKLLSLSKLREAKESLTSVRVNHTIFSLIESLTQLGRNLEATTNQGDNIRWAVYNKRYQIIYVSFLGFTKYFRTDKHEHKQ